MAKKKKINSEKFKADVIRELRTADRFQHYFAAYHPASVEGFIDTYASQKARWFEWGPFFEEQNEKQRTRWIDKAHHHLGNMLQKKLFDAQCRWRAQQLYLPHVMHTYEFVLWGQDIFNCPFLEPIQEEELNLYLEFLQHPSREMDLLWGWDNNWQDYDECNTAHRNEMDAELPDWCEFHMNRTGSGSLLLLPDLVGEKEQAYIQAYHQKKAAERKAKGEEIMPVPRDNRPYLSFFDDGVADFFVQTFEDKQTLEFYREYSHYHRHEGDSEVLDEIVDRLLNEDITIPIEAHHDWRQAIIKAYATYENRMIEEYLPAAFEQYQMNVSMGIGFPATSPLPQSDVSRNQFLDMIREGKIYLGESPELDYIPRP